MPDAIAPRPRPSAGANGRPANGRRGGYLVRVFHATEEANRRRFLAALPAAGAGRLLDVGTHRGDFTLRIAERVGAREVQGVELLPEHADVARGRGIDVTQADVEHGLPYEDGRFDVVCANQIIEHLRNTDLFLSEVRRVLAPGGVACVSTNNLSSWHNVISLTLGYQPNPMHVSDEVILGSPLNPESGRAHEDRGRIHVRLFTARALVELARHHGLGCETIESVGYYPLPPVAARLAVRIDGAHGAFLIATFRHAASSNGAVRSGTVCA